MNMTVRATLRSGIAVGSMLIAGAAAAQVPVPQTAPATDAPVAATTEGDDQSVGADIVVTGYRASLAASQEAKRGSASVIEAITPEDLGKFSDNSIADELQRVPGVQIDRNNGGRAGDRVSIRGLGSNFVTVMVNGRTPGSYGQEGLINLRSFPIDTMPTEVLSSVLVYKTATAEHVEAGLGGAIDLQTLRPLDYKPKNGSNVFGTITGRLGKNTGTDRTGKGISGIIGGKFADDTLGIYVAGLANENPSFNDFLEIRPQINTVNVRGSGGAVTRQQAIFPSYPDFGRVRRIEKRLAGSAGVQWKPTPELELGLDYTYSRFNRPDNRDYSTLQMDGGNILAGVFEPGGITIRNGAVTALDFTKYTPATGSTATSAIPYNQPLPLYYDNFATTQIGGLNVKWKRDRLTASADLSINRMRSLQDIYILYANNIYYPSYTGVNYSAGNGKGPGSFNVGAPDFTNLSLFKLNSVFRRFIQNHTDGKAGRGDIGYEVSDDLTLKAGARWSETSVDVRSASYFSDGITATQSTKIIPSLFPATVDTLFPGKTIGVNRQPTQDPRGGFAALPSLVPALTPNILTGDFANSVKANGPWGLDAKRSFRVKETTTALYGQAEGKGELGALPFEANVGLRAVHTKEDAQAFQTSTLVNADGFPTRSSSPTAIRQTTSYWTMLPSSNLTLHPSNSINIRLAAARTMSRPEFEQMAPINVISVPDPALATTNASSRGSGTIGNTQLKPQTAWNLDLTGEYYTRSGGAFVLSAFYKKVSNFIGYSTVFNNQLPTFGQQLFNVTTAVNFSSGRVYGFEVGANQSLDMLLPIKGFGIQGNFTFVDSKIDAPLNGRAFAFPGSSKYNTNGTIYYSRKGVDLRAAYVYRSNFLSSLPSLGIIDFPTYTNGYGTLDASATIKVTQGVEVIVTGSNLTRTARRDYLYNPSTFLNYYTQPRQIVGAVRLTF